MKKGFSLVELIAVIALLGIIVTIASISVISLKKNSDKDMCVQKEKYIITSAIKYGQDHLNQLNDTNDSHYGITEECSDGYNIRVAELIETGYIVADNGNEASQRLLVPGKPDTYNDSFNPKYVCIKYENILDDKDLNDYASSYNYHGRTNFQVTARMNYSQCDNY